MPRLVLQPSKYWRVGRRQPPYPSATSPGRRPIAWCCRRYWNAFVAPGYLASGITILIATGLHRPATEAEVVEILGPEIASAYAWGNHNARQLSEHRNLGVTSSGTPVYIDERFVSADLRLTLGFIEPHLMLGYSGGRKLVAPGQAARETITVLHSPKFMRDPRAVEGSIEDNPLHRELLEIARMAGHSFMVDVALTRDRRIAGVFAGDLVQAHRRGVEFVSRVMLEMLEEPVDAVITTAAGYPLDLTFYQAVKGITAASHVVKPGGKILLMAACQEGPGAPEFRRMLQTCSSWEQFLNRHRRDARRDRPVATREARPHRPPGGASFLCAGSRRRVLSPPLGNRILLCLRQRRGPGALPRPRFDHRRHPRGTLRAGQVPQASRVRGTAGGSSQAGVADTLTRRVQEAGEPDDELAWRPPDAFPRGGRRGAAPCREARSLPGGLRGNSWTPPSDPRRLEAA